MKKILLCLVIFLLFSAGCRRNRESHDHHIFDKNIEIGNAENVKTKIAFKAGELNVNSIQTEDIMKASFVYFREKWKPEINYVVEDGTGYLDIISQGSSWNTNFDENDKIEWDIRLNKDIQSDLFIKVLAGKVEINLEDCNIRRFEFDMGAGEAKLNLRNTSVRFLTFDGGAGEVKIDLSGHWQNDLDADINGGVGEITLVLPSDIGIEMDVTGILGERNIPGFSKDGSEYTNRLNGRTENNLFLDISGGIGAVNVITK